MFISHDLSVVNYMSYRLVVMQDGKIEKMGDRSIYEEIAQYTKRLISAIPEGRKENIKAIEFNRATIK